MSKIEWCDITWNPVWGCRTGCEYCYARKFAKRFKKTMAKKEMKYLQKNNPFLYDEICRFCDSFWPVWLESNFQRKFPKKPRRIFVNSMSDIQWWELEWMHKVLYKIMEYPQHEFIFLTKYPDIYSSYIFSKNCWLGNTFTNYKNYKFPSLDLNFLGKVFLNIEPLLFPVDIGKLDKAHLYDWMILGAETGNRKGKVVPSIHWIEDIELYCYKHKIPLFMKDNLNKDPNFYGDLIRQFPLYGGNAKR